MLLLLLLLLLLLWERKRQVVGVLLTPSCSSTQGHCASQQHLKKNKAGGYNFTNRCRLSWLYEPQCEGKGGSAGSLPISTAVHRSPNKLWRSSSIFNLLVGFGRACAPVRCAHPSFELIATPSARAPRPSQLRLSPK